MPGEKKARGFVDRRGQSVDVGAVPQRRGMRSVGVLCVECGVTIYPDQSGKYDALELHQAFHARTE